VEKVEEEKLFLKEPIPTRTTTAKEKLQIAREAKETERLKAEGVEKPLFFIEGKPYVVEKVEEEKLFLKEPIILKEKIPVAGVESFEKTLENIGGRFKETVKGFEEVGVAGVKGGLGIGSALRKDLFFTTKQLKAKEPETELEKQLVELGRASGIVGGVAIGLPFAVGEQLFAQTVGLGEQVYGKAIGKEPAPTVFPTQKEVLSKAGYAGLAFPFTKERIKALAGVPFLG
jgi:hypothetical protein